MAAALHAILGNEIILPHDLLPDVLDDDYGNQYENGCDTFRVKRFKKYSNLALAYYNTIHDTDYKVVNVEGGRRCSHSMCSASTGDIIHHGFSAAETTDAHTAQSTFKSFFALLKRDPVEITDFTFENLCALMMKKQDEIYVSSCCIADGLKTIGCKDCDVNMCKPFDPSLMDKVVDLPESNENDPIESILSQYAHCLAADVQLSEKARARAELSLIALAHFNKKKRKDYKLVDALPRCCCNGTNYVIHCNFIARQNSKKDVSKKLFFAELKMDGDVNGVITWTVIACQIIHGCETTAGCNLCLGREGKKVVHPARGFRFGLYPRKYLPHRQCRQS